LPPNFQKRQNFTSGRYLRNRSRFPARKSPLPGRLLLPPGARNPCPLAFGQGFKKSIIRYFNYLPGGKSRVVPSEQSGENGGNFHFLPFSGVIIAKIAIVEYPEGFICNNCRIAGDVAK